MLKVACWPVFLVGTALAVLRASVPYIPTEKRARQGRFLRLAWPHLLLALVYSITLGWTLHARLLRTPEAQLVLTSEAVWGMVGFASLAVTLAAGGIVAAWQARSPPAGVPWDSIEIERIDERPVSDPPPPSVPRD